MNLSLLVFCVVFLMAMFPIFSSPISLGGMLVLISFSLVSAVSMISNSWYGYILFLVYIGGLLVLFIYMCMVSSNYPFSSSAYQVLSAFGVSVLAYLSCSGPELHRFLGFSGWEAGFYLVEDMSVSLFVSLVILLLAVFLGVVRVILSGGALVIESSK